MNTRVWILGLTTAIAFSVAGSDAGAAEIRLSPDIDEAEIGAPIKLTVILDGPAPTPRVVNLLSSHPAVVPLPASLVVPVGSVASQTIQIRANAVSANTAVTLSLVPAAPLPKGAKQVTRQLTVLNPPFVTAITFNPTQVTVPQASTATISLSRPAAYGGVRATLAAATTLPGSSVPPAATVPSNVSINQGSASGSFVVQSLRTTTAVDVNVQVTAALGTFTRSANVVVKPDTSATLAALEIPATVTSGQAAVTGRVRLTVPAVGNQSIALAATGPAPVATHLALNPGFNGTVTIQNGQIEKTFPIQASAFPVGSLDLNAQVTATLGAVSKSAPITIICPPGIASVAVPSPIISRTTGIQGQVTLNKPAIQNEVINLTHNGRFNLQTSVLEVFTVPATVTIPAGQSAAAFPVTTGLPPSFGERTFTLNATSPQNTTNTRATQITVRPIIGASTLSANDIPGGHSATATVTLSAPAPAGGRRVDSARPTGFRSFGTDPGFLVIPEGQTSGTFQILTQLPGQADQQTLEIDNASLGLSSGPDGALTHTFIVRRPRITGLTFAASPHVLTVGSTTINGTVTLNAPAPPSGALIVGMQCSAPSLPAMCETAFTFNVPAGQTAATFAHSVPFNAVTTPDNFNAQFTAGAVNSPSASVFGSVTATLPIKVLKVASVSLAAPGVPSSTHIAVQGATPVTATVALDAVAPANFVLGIQLATASGLPSSCLNGLPQLNTWVPGAITIPAGQKQGTFTITTQAPSCAVQLKVESIAEGNKRRGAIIDLQPPS